jgi:hypothetical protein
MINVRLILDLLVILAGVGAAAAQWKPQNAPLLTRWAKDVAPDKVHPEYPRPQMVRADWQNLNGLWDYAIRPKGEDRPAQYDGQILVPFPVESALSGVMKRVNESERLWYRRAFELPAAWQGTGAAPGGASDRRVLLHFGAVDWEATVWVNGKELGTHRGGYDPFTFDISDALQKSGAQEVVVAVWDPTDAGTQPRGKQVRQPEGIWYTPTTGIWQTVWLEPVPQRRIEGLKLTPDVDHSRLVVALDGQYLTRSEAVDVAVLDSGKEVARGSGLASIEVEIPNPRLWSPDDPFLYEIRLTVRAWNDPQKVIDQVTSYVGMRKASLGQDERGVTRLLLNNKPLFMFGPLDQGLWPDGLYTAPTDEALRYDIEMTRKLGFNLARKHVKIEPERWYYWCDKLGLLVWQDMPSGDQLDGGEKREIERSKLSAEQFERELKALIDARGNHPSIVMWVPFNEGWGQYDTRRIVDWIKRYDPTRLVNSASGWHDLGVSDVHDIHAYPGPASPNPEATRAAVLGEFGGLGLPVAGHAWLAEKSWGYRSFKSSEELTKAYLDLARTLRLLMADPGLSAAVYTQTTDVEIEVNGLMTYDRALVKMDPDRIAAANRELYLPPPRIEVIVPTSEEQGLVWRYTTSKPPENWYDPTFDDTTWSQGEGGFGRKGTPGAVVRTEWLTGDIWLRRSFDLARLPANPYLRLYHDEDCQVYINGKLVAAVEGYTTSYVLVPLSDKAAPKTGRNIMAVHGHQTVGGQGVDAGIVDIAEASPGKGQ